VKSEILAYSKEEVPNIQILQPQFTIRSDVKCESDFHFAYFNSYQQYLQREEIEYTEKPDNREMTKLKTLAEKSILILGQTPIESLSVEDRLVYDDYINDKKKKVVVDHSDILLTQGGERILNYWLNHADIVVVHNPSLVNRAKRSGLEKKVVLWPGFPYPDHQYSNIGKDKPKTNTLLFSGTNYQGRNHYIDYCKRRGLPIIDYTHFRKNGGNVEEGYSQYLQLLSSSTLAFVNGYRNFRESLLSFRAVECMLLGTVVLYETGSWINYFFKPYEHYVPVRGIGDLVVKAEMLIQDQSLTISIAQRAQEYVRERYSAEKFWDLLLNRIG
jgi:hypothetical protein